MDAEETIALFEKGMTAWNAWAEALLNSEPNEPDNASRRDAAQIAREKQRTQWESKASANFKGHTFKEDVDLSGWIFPFHTTFSQVEFRGRFRISESKIRKNLRFTGTIFLGDVEISDSEFLGFTQFDEKTEFSRDFSILDSELANGLAVTNCKIIGKFNLNRTTVRGSIYTQRTRYFSSSDFRNCEILGIFHADEAVFKAPSYFSGLDLQDARLNEAQLSHADLSNTNLVGANFEKSVLDGANLLGAHTNTRTNFKEAIVDSCKINRYALECLENYGGLSKGAMMKMAIQDDVAVLRQNYSGYLRILHLIALLTFLFPYAWFLVSQWGQAAFDARYLDNGDAEHITLFEALCRYIYNGGVNWQEGFFFSLSFIAFLLAAAFNILRAIMLWKTKTLEFREEVRGFPVEFSLVEPIYGHRRLEWFTWGALQRITNKALALYLIIVALNAYHFLSMNIAV